MKFEFHNLGHGFLTEFNYFRQRVTIDNQNEVENVPDNAPDNVPDNVACNVPQILD